MDVFVLGAGFSKAISDHLPLTRDLFRPCIEAMRHHQLETAKDARVIDAFERLGGNVETWLTWLSADHPWLDESTSLRNRAAFADVSRALTSVILQAQNRALKDAASGPPWLRALVDAWANRGTTVITLNYDALVEKTFETIIPEPAVVLYSFPLAALLGTGRWGGSPGYRFELFKLHGSISWYVFPSARTTFGPVYDGELASGWGSTDDEESLLARVGGRQPLIVPPIVSKEPFLERPELRDQWLRADGRLRQAERLFLLGYSLPEADLSMRFLLDRTPEACELVPVNTNDDVAVRLKRLLKPRSVSQSFSGRPDAIKALADDYTATLWNSGHASRLRRRALSTRGAPAIR